MEERCKNVSSLFPKRWAKPSSHGNIQRLGLSHKPLSVDPHQVIEADTLTLTELSFPMLSQQGTERFLLIGLHAEVAQGKNLLVRQHFDRRLNHETIEPFH